MVLEEMEKKWKESRGIRGFVDLLDVGGEERSQHDDSQVGGLYKRLTGGAGLTARGTGRSAGLALVGGGLSSMWLCGS